MQLENKLYCHWDLVRFVSEKDLISDNGTLLTLSVTDGRKLEFMIFLEKDSSDSTYEVRVYKDKPTDKYVPQDFDHVLRYEEFDEYATFFFENFDYAKTFVEMLAYLHSEYRKRPVKKIST